MINHGESCNHCGGQLSEPKPIGAGPRKGQTQVVCTKCGHITYQPSDPAPKGLAVEVGDVGKMESPLQ